MRTMMRMKMMIRRVHYSPNPLRRRMIAWIQIIPLFLFCLKDMGSVVDSFSFGASLSSSSSHSSMRRLHVRKQSLELRALSAPQQPTQVSRSNATTVTTATTTATATTPSPRYIRWKSRTDPLTSATVSWDMQSAVTTFQRRQRDTMSTQDTVELHAALHFGDHAYFDVYNTRSFNTQHTAVLYELLLDEDLLETTTDKSNNSNNPRQLLPNRDGSSPVTASQQDEQTAGQYGWSCQVNVVNYSQPNWIHADLTRQDFLLARQEQQQQQSSQSRQRPTSNMNTNTNTNTEQPLWQLASNAVPSFPFSAGAKEAATALFSGPPILLLSSSTDSSTSVRRRLFTNLFLPGVSLTVYLRALLWMTVPSPEVSVLLLDWASLLMGRDGNNADSSSSSSSSSSATGGAAGANAGGIAGVSQVSLFIAQSLLQGRLDKVRRLVFGQVLLVANQQQQHQQQQEGNTAGARQSRDNNSNPDWSLLVTQRNNRALQVLDQTLDSLTLLQDNFKDNSKSSARIALLYGCSHCPDLHQKILQRGFTPVKREWRTAWSVPFGSSETTKKETTVATESDSSSVAGMTMSSTKTAALAAPTSSAGREASQTRLQVMSLLVAFPVYLMIGGVDWIATLDDVAQSLEHADFLEAIVDTLLYLVRHVLLYVGLSKFVLDWDGSGGRDESE